MDIFEYYRQYGASELFPDPQAKKSKPSLSKNDRKLASGLSTVYARALMDMITE